MKNIVLNIPHASINGIFNPVYGKWVYNQHFVDDCVNRWTDWYTDFLFYGLTRCEGVKTFVFPYSRFVCDVERLEDDSLNELGQGIMYQDFDHYKREELSEYAKRIIKKMWLNHQEELKIALNKDSVLIDCHSFPSDIFDCDICIGHNDDWSYNKKIVDGVIKIFEDRGYNVSVNKPYSNSIAPKTDFVYSSFMIEVNKRVYLNERILQLERDNKKWIRWDATLKNIHAFLTETKK